MRYYVYASDAKIDMLFSQIPPKLLSRIVGELNLDLKVLGVSLRKRETDETLCSKLGVVERYLENEVEIGSVTEPATWFRGELPLRSGFCGPEPGGLLYFSGVEDGVLLALIGSAHHQIGQQADASEILVRYSEMPALFSVLARQEPDATRGTGPALPTRPDDDETVIGEVFEFADALTGVRQPGEFVARRLLHGSVKDASGPVDRVLLGTPVFVALTET